MTRKEFLENKYTRDFMDWFSKRLDSGFCHTYIQRRTKKEWNCDSIYNAYEKYIWNRCDFERNSTYLEQLEYELRDSIENNNNNNCRNICLKILEWGNTLQKNRNKINNTVDLIGALKIAQNKLSENIIRDKSFYKDVYLNAGFSKIYSLCIDDYIIYDSRVGTALGFLVREFCSEKKIGHLPSILRFAYAKGRNFNVHRNPSKGIYIFPLLRADNYIENNIKFNWLINELLSSYPSSAFNQLPQSRQMRALDAALFMIGYEIPLHGDNNDTIYK